MASPPALDVKPCVDYIPPSEPLPPSTEGKSFFKVELLVGEKEKVVLPFSQDHVCRELSLDYYVATQGLPFAIRVKLSRPCAPGSLDGARVFIDSGLASRDHVYKTWDTAGVQQEDDDEDLVDTATPDHQFWFTEGDTEHVIRGFYKSQTESRRFIFDEPSRKRNSEGEAVEVREQMETLGVIRVAFSVVENIEEKETTSQEGSNSSRQAEVDENLDCKIQLTAKPGKVVKDGVTSSSYPILSNRITFERRICYNTFGGYSHKNAFQKHTNKVAFYKGMPLDVFRQKMVRDQAINAFLSKVSSERHDNYVQDRLNHPPPQEEIEVTEASTNEFVRVEDLVHFICRSLSPAASYMACTGREKRGNYGERVVQRLDCTPNERLKDYYDKEEGLVNYFREEPGSFILELDSINHSNKRMKENYKVKKAVVLIE